MRGEAWLGDLVRAVAAVTPSGQRPDPDVVLRVSAMLGFTEPVEITEFAQGSQLPTAQMEEPVTPALPSDDVPIGERGDATAPQFEEPRRDSSNGQLIGLRRSWVETKAPPQVWSDPDVDALETATITMLRQPLPHEPLLRRASTSALVQSLLSQRLPGDEIDVDALVEDVAAGRAVTSLPRLPTPTLRCGAHVLIDDSDAMSLFWRDQWELARVVRNVVGPGLTDVTVFSGSPLLTDAGRDPEPRRAVLVLSAFDVLRGGAERDEWEDYVWGLRKRGCRVVALVPFPRERWPRWLTCLMPVICWDRSTTVGTIRSALGRAA
ncbi:hypothetical protein LFM09_01215 [Lentzea alba]|uniref:hypothetical protein n=1 Tax=Lentzea alba TaxID=2714351 RepID=UPI0039BFDF58